MLGLIFLFEGAPSISIIFQFGAPSTTHTFENQIQKNYLNKF